MPAGNGKDSPEEKGAEEAAEVPFTPSGPGWVYPGDPSFWDLGDYGHRYTMGVQGSRQLSAEQWAAFEHLLGALEREAAQPAIDALGRSPLRKALLHWLRIAGAEASSGEPVSPRTVNRVADGSGSVQD